MIEPTKENLKESRTWRYKMVWLYYQNRLTVQQIKRIEKIPHWHWTLARKSRDTTVSVAEKKEKLLEIAKSEAPKPTGKHPLSQQLAAYANSNCVSFDAVFSKEVRTLRPDWFVNTTIKKKEKLLALAKSGEPKPNHRTKLGRNFFEYTSKKSSSFNVAFTDEVRALRPDWFQNQLNVITAKNKKELLALAKSGAPKPKYGTNLYKFLNRYVSNSGSFDAAFKKEIYKLNPDWFRGSWIINKEKLLALAKNGAPRPTSTTKIGNALLGYTSGTYAINAGFNDEIRALRPDWFVTLEMTTKKCYKKLLALAESGAAKPKRPSLLNARLRLYTGYQGIHGTRKHKYFNEKIRALRPDWFESRIAAANEKKKELMKLAESGAPKPKLGTKLYNAFSYQTGGRNKHSDFSKKIRILRPDWFQVA